LWFTTSSPEANTLAPRGKTLQTCVPPLRRAIQRSTQESATNMLSSSNRFASDLDRALSIVSRPSSVPSSVPAPAPVVLPSPISQASHTDLVRWYEDKAKQGGYTGD
jgi:hypothetical protein